MAAEKQISYGLKFQARALVALPADGGHSRWLVGTNALRDENEVGLEMRFLIPVKRAMSACKALHCLMLCSGGGVGL